MRKVERTSVKCTIICCITHQSNHQTSWKLTGEQFFVTHVSKTVWNRNGLTHHTTYGIFCGGVFQRFSASQKHWRWYFDFSHKHYGAENLHFKFLTLNSSSAISFAHLALDTDSIPGDDSGDSGMDAVWKYALSLDCVLSNRPLRDEKDFN